MWFGEDQRANIIKTHVPRDWNLSLDINNYYTLNSEHNWEDQCIQLKNGQTYTFNNHN
jgi:hypothetical protein